MNSKDNKKSNLISILDDENLRNSFLSDILTSLSNAGIKISQDKKISFDVDEKNYINITIPIDGIVAKIVI